MNSQQPERSKTMEKENQVEHMFVVIQWLKEQSSSTRSKLWNRLSEKSKSKGQNHKWNTFPFVYKNNNAHMGIEHVWDPGHKCCPGKNNWKPEVRSWREPSFSWSTFLQFWNLNHILHTKKRHWRKHCLLFLPRTTAPPVRLFLAWCPDQTLGRDLLSYPEVWNPCFLLSWHISSCSQADSTGGLPTQRSPYPPHR